MYACMHVCIKTFNVRVQYTLNATQTYDVIAQNMKCLQPCNFFPQNGESTVPSTYNSIDGLAIS